MTARRSNLRDFMLAMLDSKFRPHVWNNQTWQLSYGYLPQSIGPRKTIGAFAPEWLLERAKENVTTFDHVGFQETFAQDITKIYAAAGIPAVEVASTNRSSSGSYLKDIDAETRKIIEDSVQLDTQLYEYAWNRRQPSLATGT